MLAIAANVAAHPAVVARTDSTLDTERYLLVMPAGRAIWVEDPDFATAFASMREATRVATRLPACQRAYGLPCEAKLVVFSAH